MTEELIHALQQLGASEGPALEIADQALRDLRQRRRELENLAQQQIIGSTASVTAHKLLIQQIHEVLDAAEEQLVMATFKLAMSLAEAKKAQGKVIAASIAGKIH